MHVATKVNSHSRARGNELKKGYFPTFPSDIRTVLKIIRPDFGWKNRSNPVKTFTIFDPCAGEGDFLNTVLRRIRASYDDKTHPPHEIKSFAVELDAERFGKIRGTSQKLNSSFFDVQVTGRFDLLLLNPPYNRNGGELLKWVEKAAPMVSYSGAMVLIIPEYELEKQEMLDYLSTTFKLGYAFRSEEYDRFKQVVVFLSKSQSNTGRSYLSGWPPSNLAGVKEKFSVVSKRRNFSLDVKGSENENKPLLESKDLSQFYSDCSERLLKASNLSLDRLYPASYDTSIQPLSTLRTAHAVQLAAMNSQIESVTINGTFYLAKYMVIQAADSYEDPETETTTIIHKPTVEVFLMDESGQVKQAKEHGFDYVELNSELSTILLTRLTKMYLPLHEIGQSTGSALDTELFSIGLLPPQREAVMAAIKAFNAGRKGVGIRANTGTGKTWMAKAVKYILGAKRTVMVTEPQLVPQMVKEYENEGFDVHVVDSWAKMQELARTRPRGLYIIAYTRLRMHPKYILTTKRKNIIATENGVRTKKYVEACTSCNSQLFDKLRRGDKPKCPRCDAALYTYVPENDRKMLSYANWIRDIESAGSSRLVTSHNKQLPYIRLLKKIRFDLAIFDEAHNAANLMSNQGTAFIRLAASARKVLALTATVSNGMAKSLYNILWGLNPKQMRAAGWDRASATDFQAKYGAFKEVRKTDQKNRHRESERVTTYDTAGISPAALIYTLANFINVDADDFDDLPPVEREVIRCIAHPEVEKCMKKIDEVIDRANLEPEDRLAAVSVKNAAFLRVSDTFRHLDDELRLRGDLLGTLYRVPVTGLLEKEERLVENLREAVARGERSLVYTGNTQKLDMRPVLKRVIQGNVPGATVEILPDSVAPEKLVEWFAMTKAQIVIASYHRVATGLNLSQFNNLHWYDYTSNTRLAEQGDGRIRRVNTAMIHRQIFGEVRPCRFFYYTSSEVQEFLLSYTLEKRMVAKLAEGEVPDIDPAECSSGSQSFSALMTRALKEGNFDYQDPSVLLKKMTRHENAKVRAENLTPSAPQPPVESTAPPVPEPTSTPVSNVIPFVSPEKPDLPATRFVIFFEGGREVERVVPADEYEAMVAEGCIDITLFGAHYRPRKRAANGGYK